MKNISNYINESSEVTILNFPTTAAAALGLMEFMGQISDGKYENARPFGHHKWLGNILVDFSKNSYYLGPKHKKYVFTDFMRQAIAAKNDKAIKDYEWAIRDIYYICLGKEMQDKDFYKKEWEKTIWDAREVAEMFGENMNKDFEDIKPKSWQEKAVKSKYFYKEAFEKFKKEYNSITDAEIKKIFKDAQDTMSCSYRDMIYLK